MTPSPGNKTASVVQSSEPKKDWVAPELICISDLSQYISGGKVVNAIEVNATTGPS